MAKHPRLNPEVPLLVSPAKTHCAFGHELTLGNELRVSHKTPYGVYVLRTCRTCAQEYRKTRKQQLAEKRQPRATKRGQRPAEQELAALIPGRTWVELALHFGVSDVAVRRWAKEYGLIEAKKNRVAAH